MRHNIFINTLLFFGAIISFIPLSVIGVIYTFIKHIIKLDYSINRQFAPILLNFSLILDGLANSMAGELLNDILIIYKKGKTYKYGKWYDTISEVTGINEERETLNKRGKVFTKFLSFVLNENHSISAINKNRPYPPFDKK